MKNLLWMLASNALRQMLFPNVVSTSAAPIESPTSFIVKDLTKRYAALVIAGLVCSLYFVIGTVVAISALAASYDRNGFVAVGALFYTGLVFSLASAGTFAAFYWRAKKGQREEKVVVETRPLPAPQMGIMQVLEPVLSGLVAGLVSNRVGKRAAEKAIEESHYQHRNHRSAS